MKEKFKSYSFWMSVTASIILVLNNIGNVFGFAIESEAVTRIVDSICGVLILFGILTMPKSKNDDNGQILNQDAKESDAQSENKKTDEIADESGTAETLQKVDDNKSENQK